MVPNAPKSHSRPRIPGEFSQSLARAMREVLTARESSMGSSGGTTDVRIRAHSRNRRYWFRRGSLVPWEPRETGQDRGKIMGLGEKNGIRIRKNGIRMRENGVRARENGTRIREKKWDQGEKRGIKIKEKKWNQGKKTGSGKKNRIRIRENGIRIQTSNFPKNSGTNSLSFPQLWDKTSPFPPKTLGQIPPESPPRCRNSRDSHPGSRRRRRRPRRRRGGRG